jgi:hypothetical protein
VLALADEEVAGGLVLDGEADEGSRETPRLFPLRFRRGELLGRLPVLGKQPRETDQRAEGEEDRHEDSLLQRPR